MGRGGVFFQLGGLEFIWCYVYCFWLMRFVCYYSEEVQDEFLVLWVSLVLLVVELQFDLIADLIYQDLGEQDFYQLGEARRNGVFSNE